jgi:hypothetical protein
MGKDDTKQNKTIFTLRQSIKGNKMQQHYYNSRQAIKAMRSIIECLQGKNGIKGRTAEIQ